MACRHGVTKEDSSGFNCNVRNCNFRRVENDVDPGVSEVTARGGLIEHQQKWGRSGVDPKGESGRSSVNPADLLDRTHTWLGRIEGVRGEEAVAKRVIQEPTS